MGEILIGTGMQQTYDGFVMGYVIKNYDVNEKIYGNRTFGNALYGYDRDKLIVSYTSENEILAVPAYDLGDKLKDTVPFTYMDMQELEREYEEKYKDKNQSRLVNYRCNYYQREVLEIEFIYKKKLHYCRIDEVAGMYLFDMGLKKEMEI